jgi:hypothetical protein
MAVIAGVDLTDRQKQLRRCADDSVPIRQVLVLIFSGKKSAQRGQF